jgi:hypothetical protein
MISDPVLAYRTRISTRTRRQCVQNSLGNVHISQHAAHVRSASLLGSAIQNPDMRNYVTVTQITSQISNTCTCWDRRHCTIGKTLFSSVICHDKVVRCSQTQCTAAIGCKKPSQSCRTAITTRYSSPLVSAQSGGSATRNRVPRYPSRRPTRADMFRCQQQRLRQIGGVTHAELVNAGSPTDCTDTRS